MKLEIDMIIYICVAALLVVAGFVIHHHGYVSGVSDRDAYYEPILRRAAEAKIAADARAESENKRASEIDSQLEMEHAKSEQTLLVRATAAESRIADLLRQHTAASAPRCDQPVSPVSGPAIRGDGPPAGLQGDDRLATSVSSVGSACEHDADALSRWQEWYSQQRSSLTSAQTF